MVPVLIVISVVDPVAADDAIHERVTEECIARIREISARFEERRAMRERIKMLEVAERIIDGGLRPEPEANP